MAEAREIRRALGWSDARYISELEGLVRQLLGHQETLAAVRALVVDGAPRVNPPIPTNPTPLDQVPALPSALGAAVDRVLAIVDVDGFADRADLAELRGLRADGLAVVRECCNAECGWKGETARMLGSVGPLCPDCGEVTEPAGGEVSALLRIWQSHLGETRDQCDEPGRVLWDRIEAALGVTASDKEQPR